MEEAFIEGIKKDSDINRLLNAVSSKKVDHNPCFEHYVMKNAIKEIFGEEEVRKMLSTEDMRYLMYLITETEGKDNFKISNEMILQAWDQNLMDWYSYMIPPKYNLQLLNATGVDCASVPCGWEPMSHKFLGSKGKSIKLGLKDHEIKKLKLPLAKIEKMIELIDWYIKVCKGSGVGVGVNIRSCFCNTYEVLGIKKFMIKLYKDTKLIEKLFDIFTEYSVRITEKLSNRDIDCLWIDDDLCTNQGFFVHPKFIKKYWIPKTEEILKPIKKKKIPIFMHCCGNLDELIPIIINMGIDGIHPVQPNCNDIYKLKEKYGDQITFFGNMDIAGVLAFGTPEDVVKDTETHIKRLGYNGGYVVASSHSIIDRVPFENYIAMIKTAQKFMPF